MAASKKKKKPVGKLKKKKAVKPLKKNYVTVSNNSYGKRLKGTKIYFEGKKPPKLAADGRISFGKNILEILGNEFEKFHWIITEETDSITKVRGIYRIRTSLKALSAMNSSSYDRTRDVKVDIIRKKFSIIYPEHFKTARSESYKGGTIAKFLETDIFNELSSDDKEALNKFLPTYISKEAVGSVNLLKAATQIQTLKELATNMRQALDDNHTESWWQEYIHKNILIIQQGYIHAIEKMNIAIGTTKFPDYSLITHDSYLDIQEIKRPDTTLMKLDNSRGNYYWDSEMSKAISQIENYIENVSKYADAVRNYIKDQHNIELKVIRPRGIILAGDMRKIKTPKEKDDFRLLTQSIKNVSFVTYDELVTRLENYISVLEKYSK